MTVDVLGATNHVIAEFARGGGGGSGGGGGGSGGGGGDGIFGLALVGYVPMHATGSVVARIKKRKVEWEIASIVAWVICAVFAATLIGVGTLLGGGLGFFYGLIMAAGAPLGMGAGLYGWFGKLRQSKKTKAALTLAAQHDSAWNEDSLIAHAKDVFMKYQSDWMNYDTESMKTYMTPAYFYHASLMVTALKLAARKDMMSEVVISDAAVVDMTDDADDSKDAAVIGISARANDELIDTRANGRLFVDKTPFTEYYRFRRSGDAWLLDGIQEATESRWMINPSLEAFAQANNFCFSPDWGWLLLPQRGQLFGKAKFGTSDINNHVIGVYNNCLVQIYTYIPNPQNNSTKNYVIAQANVPKTYGDIVVRRKKFLSVFGIRGLKKVSMEWREFNDKYDVYASDVEQATSFELLHPAFMEKLEALPFEVNIEVVDNVVYLYADEPRQAIVAPSTLSGLNRPIGKNNSMDDAERYATMLSILREAFKQMKL